MKVIVTSRGNQNVRVNFLSARLNMFKWHKNENSSLTF